MVELERNAAASSRITLPWCHQSNGCPESLLSVFTIPEAALCSAHPFLVRQCLPNLFVHRNSRYSRHAAFITLSLANLRPRQLTFKARSNTEARWERSLRGVHLSSPVSAVQEGGVGGAARTCRAPLPPWLLNILTCHSTAPNSNTDLLLLLDATLPVSKEIHPSSLQKWRPICYLPPKSIAEGCLCFIKFHKNPGSIICDNLRARA